MTQLICFNSTLVWLKVPFGSSFFSLVSCFNSTLVWLKGPVTPGHRWIFLRFNSTLVWLKAGFRSKFECVTSLFQFHIGLIKSNETMHAWATPAYEFQFQIGLIKRNRNQSWPKISGKFQFHIGLIKSRYSKTWLTYVLSVSIPHWSD